MIEILGVAEMAEELGISRGRVRELINAGRIEGVQRVGREFAITRPDFEEFRKIERKVGRPRKDSQSPAEE